MKRCETTCLAFLAVIAATGVSAAGAAREYTPNVQPIVAPELVHPPSSDRRDFEGTWINSGKPYFLISDDPPLTAAARQVRDHRLDMQSKGTLVASPHVLCRPAGVISTFTSIFPTRVVQTTQKVLFVFEEVRGVRTIRIGARHADDARRSYYGDSVAHWDGDDLVVDTTGFNGRIWLDNMATPSSDRLHVVERIGKSPDGSKLHFHIIIEDPGTFTAPFTIERQWEWAAGARQLPADCEENPSESQVEGIVYEDASLKPVCLLDESARPDPVVRCDRNRQ